MKLKLPDIIVLALIIAGIAFIHYCRPEPTIKHNGVTVYAKDTAEYFIHLNK